MAKISDAIQVKVFQEDGEQGKRVISVTIVAEKARFVLPELLAHEGALVPVERRLKESCLREVVEFLTSGKKLLGKLKKRRGSKEGEDVEGRIQKMPSDQGKERVRIEVPTPSAQGKQ